MEIDDRPGTATADDLPFDWRLTPLGRPDWKSSDLTPEQWEAYRQLTGEQRMRISFEMTNEMRMREFARIREEHPDWIRLEVVREWIRICFLPEPMPTWLEERFREDIAAERPLAQN
jgi:hypothetical protein